MAALALAAVIGSGWPSPVKAQFAHEGKFVRPFLRRVDPDGYLNYAREKYNPYQFGLDSFKKFDILGNYMVEGQTVWQFEEQRPGIGIGLPRFGDLHDGSVRAVHGHYRFWFNTLVQVQDSGQGFQWRLSAGDWIRSQFTELTFKVPRFSGIRYDINSTKHQATFLYTSGRTTWRTNYENYWGGRVVNFHAGKPIRGAASVGSVPFFGAHWRTQVGDAIELGATFVNQHAEDVTRDEGITSLRGGLPYPMLPPRQVVVTFSDDSPEDGRGGAAVFGAPRVTLVAEGDSVITRFVSSSAGGVVVGDHIEANGFETISFSYDMPVSPTPVAMMVEAMVANDYRVEISQSHTYFIGYNAKGEGRSKQLDEFGNKRAFEDRETPPYIITRAPGNIQDLSNKAPIKFRYGFTTGQSIYGSNFTADFAGLKARGEFALSSTYFQFPTGRGVQLSPLSGAAYFIDVLKEAGPLNLGFEYFHIGPKYASYMGTRGGPTLHTDRAGASKEVQQTHSFPWVDDNDDGDMWSDDDILKENASRTNIELNRGVYPGRDQDFDGHVDDDQNSNDVPDWTEPFLLYYSDPLEFTYGFDNNNNFWIDHWENDERPDYPYDKDLEGPHYFVEYKPTRGLKFSVGQFDTQEIAGGGENVGRYFRSSYLFDRGDAGMIEWRHDTKRVRDSIRNSVYVFRDVPTIFGPQPFDRGYDHLEMLNSLVHTAFLGTRYNQVLNLHIENNFKFMQNHKLPSRFEDGMEQSDSRVSSFLMVNRADYRFRRGRWSIWPQFKRLTLVEQENSKVGAKILRRSQSWTAPILKVDFHVTPKTVFRFGQQGLRMPRLHRLFDNLGLHQERARNFFAFQFRDKSNPRESFSASDMVLMIQNTSAYFGTNLVASLGFHRRRSEFRERDSRFRDEKVNRFFVEVVGFAGR